MKRWLLGGLLLGVMQLSYAVAVATPASLPLIRPPALKRGDTVALLASGFRVPEQLSVVQAEQRLQALGLKVILGKSINRKQAYYGGTVKQRAADLNAAFANPKVNAIMELRGGSGSAQLLPYLNYAAIKQHPKIFMGFSDITALLLGITQRTGLETFHGTMGVEPWPAFTVQYLKQVLFQKRLVTFHNPKTISLSRDIIPSQYPTQILRPGIAEGRLLGGNLTTLTTMLGSGYVPSFKHAILFVEDVNENYYQIDRMLAQLQLSGRLKQLSGFVFGLCVGCQQQTRGHGDSILGAFTLQEILHHYIYPLHIPAYSGAMIGHDPKMFVLPEGAHVRLNAKAGTLTLLHAAVR